MKPMSWDFSRKHWRHMFRAYFRIRPWPFPEEVDPCESSAFTFSQPPCARSPPAHLLDHTAQPTRDSTYRRRGTPFLPSSTSLGVRSEEPCVPWLADKPEEENGSEHLFRDPGMPLRLLT